MIKLLPKDLLIKTGSVDYAEWNYRKGLLGYVQRRRFLLIKTLLGNRFFDQLLEIGYGSGVFSPELNTHCGKLFGIDIHPFHEEVAENLKKIGVNAEMKKATAESLPYPNEKFDAIVTVSTLEFIPDLEKAMSEFKRVLKTEGSLFVVTPVESRLADTGFQLLTGKNAEEEFEESRQKIIPSLKNNFEILKHRTFPLIGGTSLCIYNAYELRSH